MNSTANDEHLSADDVLGQLNAIPVEDGWPRSVTVDVPDGITAWDPTSTRRVLTGPLRVRYEEHIDGGITATVSVQHD